ncbi:MAG: TetR/AcrR family transcriptional regulator [Bacteroidota bacterium]
MGTRQKILDKALEMFNERGIEYVGLRELAAVLSMRVSNISYYFPTKDDLVYALSQELSRENSELIAERESLTMTGFIGMLQKVFHNHVKYRCLLLSVVHLMKQNKHLAAAYKQTQTVRNATLTSNLQVLADGGYLLLNEKQDLEFLVSGISLISRFWISEAAVSLDHLDIPAQIRHYLFVVTRLLMPYATVKGREGLVAVG